MSDKDSKRKSLDEDIAEVWRLLREYVAESRASAKEFDRKLAKDREEFAQQLQELGQQIGGAHNRWGKIIEDLIAEDISHIIDKHLQGQAHYISTRVRPRDRSWEIDVLATNGDIAVPVEVKTTLYREDIDSFVERILVPFTTLIPEHKHKRIYGIIAFVKIEGNKQEVIDHAIKHGLIIVKAMHGTSHVLNDEGFAPRDFCPR